MLSVGAEIVKTLGFLVLLYFITQGSCFIVDPQCPPSKIKITQAPIKNSKTTHWKVDITNTCPCFYLNVKLSCPGFKPTSETDPSIISKYDESHCLLNDNNPLFPGHPLSFTYTGDQVHFAPFDFGIACS